ncbi:MAG: NYN domain-containing protein [Clostridia bacterium]
MAIYGITSTQTSRWKNELLKIRCPHPAVQQYCGKNATDSALIIDAMDILYTGNVEGFCIVSSDSNLPSWPAVCGSREWRLSGWAGKTPRSFRAACTVFTNLEIL